MEHQAFIEACKDNDLVNAAKHLNEIYSIPEFKRYISIIYIMKNITEKCDVNTLKWLIKQFSIKKEDICPLIYDACYNNNIILANYIFTNYGNKLDIGYVKILLTNVISKGYFKSVVFICTHLSLNKILILCGNFLHLACENSNFKILNWLIIHYQISDEELASDLLIQIQENKLMYKWVFNKFILKLSKQEQLHQICKIANSNQYCDIFNLPDN